MPFVEAGNATKHARASVIRFQPSQAPLEAISEQIPLRFPQHCLLPKYRWNATHSFGSGEAAPVLRVTLKRPYLNRLLRELRRHLPLSVGAVGKDSKCTYSTYKVMSARLSCPPNPQ